MTLSSLIINVPKKQCNGDVGSRTPPGNHPILAPLKHFGDGKLELELEMSLIVLSPQPGHCSASEKCRTKHFSANKPETKE